MRVEVYDEECMVNLFTYTGFNRTEDKWYVYVIHKFRNDYIQLIQHVLSGDLVMVEIGRASCRESVLRLV